MRHKTAALGILTSTLLLCGLGSLAPGNSKDSHQGSSFWNAICPVVYPLDQTSSDRGYHYIFYGDAFFIGREGYLLTAAHVLNELSDGGQPYVLVRRVEGPPRLVKVKEVAVDGEHDIALLRATPNPFESQYEVAALSLAENRPDTGAMVFAAALRPAHLKDPHTFDAPEQDRDDGEVLQYTKIRLDNGQPETEVFLFNHEVLRGHSGAPVFSQDGTQVVGIVEGQWLHSTPLSVVVEKGTGSQTMGAAIPISYAIALLEQQHVSWRLPSETRQTAP